MADILLTLGLSTKELQESLKTVQKQVAATGTRVTKTGVQMGYAEKQTQAVAKAQKTYTRALKDTSVGAVGQEKTVKGAAKAMDRHEGATKRSLRSMIKWGIGWTLAYAAIRTFLRAIGQAIKGFTDLESAMARIRVVTTSAIGDMEESMRSLQSVLIDYLKTHATTTEAASEALFKLSTAHLNSAEAAAALSAVMDLTIATTRNLSSQTEEASRNAELIAGIYNNFRIQLERVGDQSEQFRYIAALLARTFADQQVELAELGAGLKYVIAAFATAGISVEAMIASIGVLNTQYIKAQKAGTGLRRMLAAIAKDADKMAERLGIAVDPEATINYINIIRELSNRIDESGMVAKDLAGFFETFGLRGQAAALSVARGFREVIEQIEKYPTAVDDLAKMVEDRMNTTQAQLMITRNLWGLMGQAALGAYGPDMIQRIKSMNTLLTKLIPIVRTLAWEFEQVTISVMGMVLYAKGFWDMVSKWDVSTIREAYELSGRMYMEAWTKLQRNLADIHRGALKEAIDLIKKDMAELMAAVGEDFESLTKEGQKFHDALRKSWASSIADMLRGTKILEDAFKALGDVILEKIIEQWVEVEFTDIFKRLAGGVEAITPGKSFGEMAMDIIKGEAPEAGAAMGRAFNQTIQVPEIAAPAEIPALGAPAAREEPRIPPEVMEEAFPLVEYTAREHAETMDMLVDRLENYKNKLDETTQSMQRLQSGEAQAFGISKQQWLDTLGKKADEYKDSIKLVEDQLDRVNKLKPKPGQGLDIIGKGLAGLKARGLAPIGAAGMAGYAMGGMPGALGGALGAMAQPFLAAIPVVGPMLSMMAPMLGGVLGKLFGSKKDRERETRHQTITIASRIDNTNKLLQIQNRDLRAIRRGFEYGWGMMPTSAYFQEAMGVERRFALSGMRGFYG